MGRGWSEAWGLEGVGGGGGGAGGREGGSTMTMHILTD